MADNEALLRRTVPLMRVVKAAIIDTYDDIGKTQQRYAHWAARGLRKLSGEVLRMNTRDVLLPVNPNFMTAPLPADFEQEIFVGYINEYGERIPFHAAGDLPYYEGIEVLEDCPKCKKCQQNLQICQDLQITEETNLVIIDGTTYEETIVKRLMPNGDYFMEKSTPYKNLETGLIEYIPTKDFITNLDLRECGCLDESAANLQTLKTHCPEVWSCHYSKPCDCCDNVVYGKYRIYPEEGIIQIETSVDIDYLYLRYNGYLAKIRGQYHVPHVAFETLVEWVKYKSIQNKKKISPVEKREWFNNYKRERNNMEIRLHRLSLDDIIEAALSIPKFDLSMNRGWQQCFDRNKKLAQQKKACTINNSCGDGGTPAAGGTSPQAPSSENVVRIIETTNEIAYEKIQFEVGADGAPLQGGETSYTILDEGIHENSVNMVLDGSEVHENLAGVFSYTIVYGANGVTLSFNAQVEVGWNLKFTYTKAVSI